MRLLTDCAVVRPLALALLLGAAVVWSSCRSPRQQQSSSTAAHAVHGEKLGLVMRQMERVDAALLPPELDLGPEQERRRAEIATLAGSIARTAHGIPEVLGDAALPDPFREEFVQLAFELEDKALTLQDAAQDPETRDLRPLLDSLHETCTTCHTRFRVLPAAR